MLHKDTCQHLRFIIDHPNKDDICQETYNLLNNLLHNQDADHCSDRVVESLPFISTLIRGMFLHDIPYNTIEKITMIHIRTMLGV